MSAYEQPGVRLDPEEELLLAFSQGAYDVVIDSAIEGLGKGKSPSFLSIVRPDLLVGFAEALLSDKENDAHGAPAESFKAPLFESFKIDAAQGEPEAISALPKFATSPGQLANAMGLVLDYKETVTEWRSGRTNLQFIGSYNPQHIGHRATMGAALRAAGDRSSLMAQVVANHPIKKDSLPPYEGRYSLGEKHLYTSSLIDPTRITLIDVPVGPGLAKTGAAQIELLADVSGDPSMRWLMGSDKFMSDVKTAREGNANMRAVVRFADPRMHLYVARRVTHERTDIQEGIDFVQERFGTSITFIDEAPNDMVLAASASRIRQLRSEGKDQEADRIQFADLL